MYLLKKTVTSCLLTAMPFLAFSQFSISGKISSKKTQEIIAGANIKIDNAFTTVESNSEGNFELKNLKKGTYTIKVSFVGYLAFMDTIELSENKTIVVELNENSILMDEVIVSSTRVDDKSAMAYSTVTKEQIAEQNLGQDLPFLLNQQTSIVTTSDAGGGVGYTGIRIRGTDATRVNVTINGIPVNDAESQGTYWVDLPDIASSIDNIQIQRGVGTSTNGAGAFGGSLNIQTTKLNPVASAEVNSSVGSFNTFKNTVNVGTGLINNKFAVDARFSKINSDGFIDRATSDLKSFYLSGAYYGKKDILKFITFTGYEETYQAWYGIPEARLKGNVDTMNAYISNNYLDESEADNLLNSSNRTYNPYTYKNQVDHYIQNYYQLHYSHEFNNKLNANIALHYTKGKGYYEEYMKNQAFADYGYDDLMVGSTTISTTNLIRRRWLDNDFYGTTYSINYHNNKNFAITLGGAWNKYDGLHYGEIIWAQYASNSVLNQNYYKDTAQKTDFNVFVKANYLIAKKLNAFADLQYRTIDYSFLGFDNNFINTKQNVMYNFFNPKFGLNYEVNTNINFYASYSVANKEPGRDDLVQSTALSRPKSEQLNDIEIGYRHNVKRAMWGINFYYMQYNNQLILTGAINDVGAYNRENVANSFREGIEVEVGLKIVKNLTWNMNATFSKNKIKNFHEYIDNYDTGIQNLIVYSESDIAFSPNIIAGSTITYEPIKNLKLNFITKYVGEQFLDNTSNSNRKLDAYFVNDFRINYSIKTKFIHTIGITLAINNLFNEMYESNGYTWGYYYGAQRHIENFYFPQAGTNYMLGLTLKF